MYLPQTTTEVLRDEQSRWRDALTGWSSARSVAFYLLSRRPVARSRATACLFARRRCMSHRT